MSILNAMNRLQEACRLNGPLCIGLDTDPSYLPESVLKKYITPSDAVLAYNKAIIDTASNFTACYKVQIAYYEAMGLSGLKVYSETLKYVKEKNIPVIADIKRGDIADTAAAYARAHFTGDFEADIITVNPYMGFDTLTPFTKYCNEGKGIFVLLRTSNPGMVDIEKQKLSDGSEVLERIGTKLNDLVKDFNVIPGSCSPVGAVVGCTEEADAKKIRDMYPDVFFLIPGYGAQGGAARIAATLLSKAGGTVNSSRGILTAWKKSVELTEKREAGTLTLDDIVYAASKAAEYAKKDLLSAKAALL